MAIFSSPIKLFQLVSTALVCVAVVFSRLVGVILAQTFVKTLVLGTARKFESVGLVALWRQAEHWSLFRLLSLEVKWM